MKKKNSKKNKTTKTFWKHNDNIIGSVELLQQHHGLI